jgi:energy-coupling factor transporter transmembrane protein EcfT
MFTRICNPAKLYLVVSAILLVFAVFKKMSAGTFIVNGAFILLWTFLLNWLCSKGFGNVAWVIVLLPFVFLFLTLFTVMDCMGFKDGFVEANEPAPLDDRIYKTQGEKAFRELKPVFNISEINSTPCIDKRYKLTADLCQLSRDQQGCATVQHKTQHDYDECVRLNPT